ncbi:putative alpha-1,3-mannosyl-glycoprotein 2-beta-N-acetylglucosaminyltransferase [Helianthus annuus]|uniref:alpha-1,3-mannosyl-glycoprotein 2-beta-N-acetylglucosaminyltransferase n=1 Tax=Helianthus annuus TaxID=4232 RepID=UPI000B8FCDD0|nr:alpha-1,3-mannosyl-glycoprotein 2-beta-N-acetylglucosaminyltransferase [Helianthus annuus]XP_035834411.1 alpha-1,3-mannosyl-glycoprotein 2-beta-N-acetylglucosaminyltransferase [Helianthus annuus]KAJ0513644.1 putative alpha-1,3-mannosyl-glycoprotein 2-beta-N-acetylglucosaminyltransferase [Helianthus annuus]KAJ0521517.1 putative alpha-1,3-mannosyl-glycoprotein 2-beta-N-acetylglucosaminyltransferase [Helianthus annuus]KAJ0529749.1 putative alpha-1,3-mannosyl-glycoprotein 2-beta-N-acetylglucosam
MARWSGGLRCLLLLTAIAFIYTQVRLFKAQSEYAEKITAAVEGENHCTSQMRLLIDQISMQKERVVSLEEIVKRQQEEREQLRTLVQNLERKGVKNLFQQNQVPVAAVVIMACNRADYLERTIKSILKYHASASSKFPIFVSQDGSNPDVRTKAMSYKQLTYMQHLDYEPVHTERPGELIAYYKIARHYKWALDQLFYKHRFNRVIILEDDMEISPDFFAYFEAGADLLDKDKSIMAISSWNDNGQKQFVHDPYTLYRSDFFPGLGWMLSKSTWDELSPKWPKAYWDDWLRLQENHKGRQFIRPEVCRTYNFGEHGSSLGQFFHQYLKPIRLNDRPIDWKSMNLTYLMEDKFVKHFGDLVKGASPVFGTDLILKINNVKGDARIAYRDQEHFEEIARQFGIFEEWKDGVPRTAYKGVVVFRYKATTRRIFLVGPDSLEQLGIQN